MFSRWDMIKPEYYGLADRAFDTVKLEDDMKCGEIISDYWLILPSESPFGDYIGEYIKEKYVSVVDIRYLDVFSTDICYDNRADLIKLPNDFTAIGSKSITLNRYSYNKI